VEGEEAIVNELKLGLRTADLDHSLRIYPVSEEMFVELMNEDVKAELIDGVMIVHSPASPRHDDVSGFLRLLMRSYAASKRRGKVLGPDSLIRPAPGRMFAPDLFFLERRRVPRPLPRAFFEIAPDLVCEVLSPSNREEDLEEKRPAYREAGIPEIWLVDPKNEEVLVDRRRRKRYTTDVVSIGRVASEVLPDFWVEAGWMWQDPLPNEMECLQEILG
jgi:Uma2 family endonuclease